MKRKRKSLTEGSIVKQLAGLALPMMLGILSLVAFNLVDTYFVGKLGKTQLAALSFTFPVIMVIFSIVQGLGIGATALISKSIGQNNRQKAARETTDSLTLSFIVGGLFIMVGLLTVKPTFVLLGASQKVLPYVVEYMTIWYFALLFVIVPFIGNSAIRSTGDAMTPSLIMIFAVIINAILDPLLIFGYGPFPEMGLKGAAYATAISRAMTMVLAFLILRYREKLIRLDIPSWKTLIGCWKAILYIGIPSGLSRVIIPVMTGIITSLLARYGESAVAAFGVGTRIEFLAMSLLIAISASIGPFTGQNYGAYNFGRIQKGMHLSTLFAVSWGLVLAVLFFFFGESLAGVFTQDTDVIAKTALYLKILPVGFGFQGVVQIVNSNLNTLNKPIHASGLILLQMFGIALPLIFIGREFFEMQGIFFGWMGAYVIGGIVSFFADRKIVSLTASRYLTKNGA